MTRIVILLICFTMISCQNQSSESEVSIGKHPASDMMKKEMIVEPPRTSKPPIPPKPTTSTESKIIKMGTIQFEVNDLEDAKSIIDSLVHKVDGYYENELYRTSRKQVAYSLSIRVPNSSFNDLAYSLENGIGKLKSKNLSARDVTEEYMDLNIRLENNIAYLKQYQAILKKARSIKEILEVQEKIRRIEEEIDSKKGQLKYLESNVNYSTLNLDISQTIILEKSNKSGFGRRVLNALDNGVQGFLNFIIVLLNYWPFLILISALYFGRKSITKIIKRNKQES